MSLSGGGELCPLLFASVGLALMLLWVPWSITVGEMVLEGECIAGGQYKGRAKYCLAFLTCSLGAGQPQLSGCSSTSAQLFPITLHPQGVSGPCWEVLLFPQEEEEGGELGKSRGSQGKCGS